MGCNCTAVFLHGCFFFFRKLFFHQTASKVLKVETAKLTVKDCAITSVIFTYYKLSYDLFSYVDAYIFNAKWSS